MADNKTPDSKQDGKRFRSSVAGFNKKDVISYIQSLSDQYDRMISDKKHRISEFDRETKELRAKVQELEQSAADGESLEAQVNQLSQENAELKERASELEDKNIALKQRVKGLTDENDELKQQLVAGKNESLRDEIENETIAVQEAVSEELEAGFESIRQMVGQLTEQGRAMEDLIRSGMVQKTDEATERMDKAKLADLLIRAERTSQKLMDDCLAEAKEKKARIEEQITLEEQKLEAVKQEVERVRKIFKDLYSRYVVDDNRELHWK